MAGAVIQATGRTELEDGTRPGGRLNRLHAHCGVCTGPTVGVVIMDHLKKRPLICKQKTGDDL